MYSWSPLVSSPQAFAMKIWNKAHFIHRLVPSEKFHFASQPESPNTHIAKVSPKKFEWIEHFFKQKRKNLIQNLLFLKSIFAGKYFNFSFLVKTNEKPKNQKTKFFRQHFVHWQRNAKILWKERHCSKRYWYTAFWCNYELYFYSNSCQCWPKCETVPFCFFVNIFLCIFYANKKLVKV